MLIIGGSLGGVAAALAAARMGKTSFLPRKPCGSAARPPRVENLLPACKNLGVTHVTNGAFRVHPTEWNIGESAGALAAFYLAGKLTPRQVRNTPKHLADFQRELERQGVELVSQ